MAEAEVADNTSNNVSSRYYCHMCSVEIVPQLPDFNCPRCNNGFIEPINTETMESDSDESSDMDVEFMLDYLSSNLSGSQPRPRSESTPSTSSSNNRRIQLLQRLNPSHVRRTRSGGERDSSLLEEIIMQMTFGVFDGGSADYRMIPAVEIPMLLSSNLAGNPGDYAWGRGGLDTIITQLMNQLDGTGPPPLPKEEISQIPSVKITQQQCDAKVQCSVCMEDFKFDESVRQLNCEHCYHTECITPWLELHGTCPVCRKTLSDHNPRNDSDILELLTNGGMEFIGGSSNSSSSSNSNRSTTSSSGNEQSTTEIPSTSESSHSVVSDHELD